MNNAEGYVFTTNGRPPFSGFSKSKKRLDARMLEVAQGEGPEITAIPQWTLHDLRRTGASRIQRLGFENNVAEACLNHIDDDEYLQDDFYDQKIKAFDAWSREIKLIVEHQQIEAPTLAPHEHDAGAWAKHCEALRQPYRQLD